MITYEEILNLNYYKKASFTGWIGGMRFLIRREIPDGEEAVFHAWVWPGPYIFSLTEDSRKIDACFPFTEEGRRQTADWINEQYQTHSKLWPRRKIDFIR